MGVVSAGDGLVEEAGSFLYAITYVYLPIAESRHRSQT